jgi:hypothetical protein
MLDMDLVDSKSMHLFIISHNLKLSGFYSNKGKGKQILTNEQETESSRSSSEIESGDDLELKKAIALSLQKNKTGESSMNKGGSPEKDDFDTISGYTQNWKNLFDRRKTVTKNHNILREKLNNDKTVDKSELETLNKAREEINKLNLEISVVEEKLKYYDIDPSEQFNTQPDSATDSDYSSGSISPNKDSSSDYSETRPNKRVKYLNAKDNTDMTIGFPIFNAVLSSTIIIRVLSIIVSGFFLVDVDLNILDDLTLYLLSLYLTYNLIKLMFKIYNTIIMLYKSQLNKDHMVIYANILFTIIMILLYFGSNDVYVFYI